LLTDTAIKAVKSTDKPFKVSDGNGLYLLVRPNGTKSFIYRYRFGGKSNTISLGIYPTTTLKEARQKRDDAKKLVSNGTDLSTQNKIQNPPLTIRSQQ